MFSHMSPVPGGIAEYIQEIGASTREQAQFTGRIDVGVRKIITGLKHNRIITRTIALSGSVRDLKCTGCDFSDPYGNWEWEFLCKVL